MTGMPVWALTLTYWLHMLATVTWIGGLAAIALIVLPASGKALQPEERAALLDQIQKRLEALGGFSLFLLLATGMFQMSASPSFEGYLSTANPWGRAMLLKHGLFVLMLAVSGAQTWWLLPNLRHALLLQKRGKGDQAVIAKMRRRETILFQVNLVLSLLILGATALARASG